MPSFELGRRNINQCDGCRRGLPVVKGIHRGPTLFDSQACTKDRYRFLDTAEEARDNQPPPLVKDDDR